MIVEDYWTGIARRLQIESGVLNGLIPHMLERGVANELSLARIIENLVPPRIGVGSGVIFDRHGKSSAQTDLILFDKAMQPQLMNQTNQVMFPVETVRLVIEVKTRLSAKDIKTDFPSKRAKLDALTPMDGRTLPKFALFAYGFADNDYNRAKELTDLADKAGPDLACVVTPGYVRLGPGRSGFVPLRSDSSEAEGSEDGAAQIWEVPEASHSGSVIRSGMEYPVFQFGSTYGGDQYVGDPGRALLNFCLGMLAELDGAGDYGWITGYTSASVSAVLAVT